MRYRNLNLFSISYASVASPIGPDLPGADQLLPWNPQIFGRKDSHLVSLLIPAFSLFLKSTGSLTVPLRLFKNAPLPTYLIPELRCRVSAPDIFGAGPLD